MESPVAVFERRNPESPKETRQHQIAMQFQRGFAFSVTFPLGLLHMLDFVAQ